MAKSHLMHVSLCHEKVTFWPSNGVVAVCVPSIFLEVPSVGLWSIYYYGIFWSYSLFVEVPYHFYFCEAEFYLFSKVIKIRLISTYA